MMSCVFFHHEKIHAGMREKSSGSDPSCRDAGIVVLVNYFVMQKENNKSHKLLGSHSLFNSHLEKLNRNDSLHSVQQCQVVDTVM